jgi:hypothetical protein
MGPLDPRVGCSARDKYDPVRQLWRGVPEPVIEDHSAHLGHQLVAHHRICGPGSTQILQCLRRGCRLCHAEARPFQEGAERAAHRRFVVHHKDRLCKSLFHKELQHQDGT